MPSKLAEDAPELAAAAMSQQDNLVKKWNGSLRRANTSPRDEDGVLTLPVDSVNVAVLSFLLEHH